MNRKRVLIIDDEEDFCNFTKMYLENKHDFEVQTLTDSREAIRVVKTFMPDIIILDLLMPHIGGFEICELLNKDDETKGVPVIVTTALSDRSETGPWAPGIGVMPTGKERPFVCARFSLEAVVMATLPVRKP